MKVQDLVRALQESLPDSPGAAEQFVVAAAGKVGPATPLGLGDMFSAAELPAAQAAMGLATHLKTDLRGLAQILGSGVGTIQERAEAAARAAIDNAIETSPTRVKVPDFMTPTHWYSQDGQDTFVLDLLGGKRDGVFVDVGAFDGANFSNTLKLEQLGWTGVCIEPDPGAFAELTKNRRCSCHALAIAPESGTAQFRQLRGGTFWTPMCGGLNSSMTDFHKGIADREIGTYGGEQRLIDVPTQPLSEILTREHIPLVHYMSIDVEGGELGVLRSIDWSRVRIQIISSERLNDNDTTVREFLAQKGYELIGRVGFDDFYRQPG